MITTQILIKNNEKIIKKTLDSIKSISSKIIIGDLGSNDKTIEICKEYQAEIVNLNKETNYSKIRNYLAKKNEINFYIEPGEVLVEGHEIIKKLKKTTNIYVFQNDVVSKEIRIWKEDLFKNPVYETIVNKDAEINNKIIISSKSKINNNKEKLELVKKWYKDRPLDLEPCYYMAICYLSIGDYKNFLFHANKYCRIENKTNNSLIMIKYYIAQVNLHIGKPKEAAELALTCLSYYPSFAEFWCLLGDIYYFQKKWEKAICFYENAKIIGCKRKNIDDMPIEIKKYKEYPEKIINNIKKIKNNITIMG